MTADIRKLVHSVPFVPFTIHTTDGGHFRIPTGDHVAVPPKASRVFIFSDEEEYEIVSPLMISRITVDRRAEESVS